MKKENRFKLTSQGLLPLLFCYVFGYFILGFCGCAELGGYSNESLFPEEVDSVYVKMFDNRSFRRNVEYMLSEAVSKRIESETPYKVISSRDRAETLDF